jgi:hypothetical protein
VGVSPLAPRGGVASLSWEVSPLWLLGSDAVASATFVRKRLNTRRQRAEEFESLVRPEEEGWASILSWSWRRGDSVGICWSCLGGEGGKLSFLVCHPGGRHTKVVIKCCSRQSSSRQMPSSRTCSSGRTKKLIMVQIIGAISLSL